MLKKISAVALFIIALTFISSKNYQYKDLSYKDKNSGLRVLQYETILSYLNDGDIIFRLGDRVWSDYFKELSLNEKRYSHVGIVRKQNYNVTVIHAEGHAFEGKDQVNEVSLNDFLEHARSIGIYRLRTIEGESISNTALEYMGCPFDWQFDMDDDSKLYCSELLYVILRKLDKDTEIKKIWVKEMGKYIIPLDMYTQTEYFEEIYSIDFST